MSNIGQYLPFYLNQAVGATDTSITVRGLKDSRGNYITAMPSGIAKIYFTIEPTSASNQEICYFTGITDLGNGVVTLTGVVRNQNPVAPYTSLTANVLHSNNSTCIISNNPQVYQEFVKTNEASTVSAVVTFTASPVVPTGTNPTDAVNYSQVTGIVAGQMPISSTTVLGAVKNASDPTKTLSTTTVTIASPAVFTATLHGLTVNDAIKLTTTGALPTGLTVGTLYYVITAGLTTNTFEVSTTVGGTAVVTTGSQSGIHTLYRALPYVINDQDTRLPTQAENDALVGTSGTQVSSSNKLVDNADTTGTGVVVRLSIVSAMVFGTGADGAYVFADQGSAPSSTTKTDNTAGATIFRLDRDIYCTNLTINATVTLNPNGYRIFATGTTTINGSIKANGGAGGNASGATGGTAGAAAHAAGTIPASNAGIAGGTGGSSAGQNGGSVSGLSLLGSIGSAGSAGGTGGNNTGGVTFGGSSTGSTVTPIRYPKTVIDAVSLISGGITLASMFMFTSGGGSGGGGGSSQGGGNAVGGGGGGGGASGGMICLYSNIITVGAAGSIQANGGNGGNAANATGTTASGGGGATGAGGSGGVLLFVYRTYTNGGSVTTTAGTKGLTVGTGVVGGGSGTTGTDGVAGVTYQFQIA